MPRLGFRTAGYRNQTMDQALASIAAAGYDGVEICLEHPEVRPEQMDHATARLLADTAARHGLQIASVSYHGDGEPPEQRLANQIKSIKIAGWFGTDVLILNASARVPGKEPEQWDRLRGELGRMLPMAGDLGIYIALEPEPGHFLHSSADMQRLLQEVDDPALAVNLDVGHAFLTDKDVTATIEDLGPAIVHTHIEGMPAAEHRHLVPGEGDLDLVAIHQALQRSGFAGFYTVDLFNIADDPENYARRSYEALREIVSA